VCVDVENSVETPSSIRNKDSVVGSENELFGFWAGSPVYVCVCVCVCARVYAFVCSVIGAQRR